MKNNRLIEYEGITAGYIIYKILQGDSDVGEKLITGDKINVKAGSYLALLHLTGMTVEVKKEGTTWK